MKYILLVLLLFSTINTQGQQSNLSTSDIFSEVSSIQIDNIMYSDLIFTDVNSDTWDDLIFIGYNGSDYIIKLYINNNAAFAESTSSFQSVDSGSIATGDIDNDDDTDLIVTGSIDNYSVTHAYLNDGDGSFTKTDISLYGVQYSKIALIDLNKDNIADLFLTGMHHNGPYQAPYIKGGFFYNDGNTGDFSPIGNEFVKMVYLPAVAFEDIDNDNDPDLIMLGRSESGNLTQFFKNTGYGFFEPAENNPFEYLALGTVDIEDLDNDGYKDVVLTGINQQEPVTSIYLNDGTGTFKQINSSSLTGVCRSSVDLADIDSDGDMDLVLSGTNKDEVPLTKVFANEGNANYFEVTQNLLVNVERGKVYFNDMDKDGDPDLLITGRDENKQIVTRLYENICPEQLTVVTGVKPALLDSFKIMNNPTIGVVNYKVEDSLINSIILVRNAEGKLLGSYTIKKNFGSVSLEGESGVYFLEIINKNQESMIYKVIKQ